MEEGSGEGGVPNVSKSLWGATLEPTEHLFVANCGPAVGLPLDVIEEAFAFFGEVAGIRAAGDSGNRVIVSFVKVNDAEAAKKSWSGRPCSLLQDRIMYMQHSIPRPCPISQEQYPAATTSGELGIPGLVMYPDFVSVEEEKELLAAVDPLPWHTLSKRRVQHYGYEFSYKSRNVDTSQKLGELPMFVAPVVQRISALPELSLADELSLPLDQLTVNEYPRGVGLSPHIDTHSAFEGSIISLSLAGNCVMEFRRYRSQADDLRQPRDEIADGQPEANLLTSSEGSPSNKMERKALFLPARSLIILSDEARYAWHHYIPHHKVDLVADKQLFRNSRRVSFTFRKVRVGQCSCKFSGDCDSQVSAIQSVAPGCLPSLKQEKCLDSDELDEKSASGLASEETAMSIPEGHKVEEQQQQILVRASPRMKQRIKSAPPHSELLGTGTVLDACETATIATDTPPRTQSKEAEHLSNASSASRRAAALSTPEIEKLYVHKVYDAIAPHFSATRFAKWPRVALFLDTLAPGSLVADSGCGNGKYLGFNPTCFFIGCDISPPLVSICARRGHEALVADALHLPYRPGLFDAAISIAVLHHLSNDERRFRAMEELVRAVRPGGKVLITVWAREQEDEGLVKKWTPLSSSHHFTEEWIGSGSGQDRRLDERVELASSLDRISEQEGSDDLYATSELTLTGSDRSETGEASRDSLEFYADERTGGIFKQEGQPQQQQEYFVPWHLPYHRAEINGASAAAVASGFARRDEKKGAVVYDRYYHVFSDGELERLASSIHGAQIVDRFYDKSNWCIVLQKG